MKIDFISVPLWYGCDRQGVELGPKKLLGENLVEIFEKNGNQIENQKLVKVDEYKLDEKYESHPTMKYYKGVIDANEDLASKVEETLKEGKMPFTLGGDHSLGLGSLAGVSSVIGDEFAVIWIDAHADINTTESSPSGNIHGMPLGASLGRGDERLRNIHFEGRKVNPRNCFIIGGRSIDDGEVEIIDEDGLNVWYMDEIKERGISQVIKEVKEILEKRNIKDIHISYDIDSLSSELVPGTGTPVKHGMNIEDSQELIRELIRTKMVRSVDFVEFNPVIDKNDKTLHSVMSILKVYAEELGRL